MELRLFVVVLLVFGQTSDVFADNVKLSLAAQARVDVFDDQSFMIVATNGIWSYEIAYDQFTLESLLVTTHPDCRNVHKFGRVDFVFQDKGGKYWQRLTYNNSNENHFNGTLICGSFKSWYTNVALCNFGIWYKVAGEDAVDYMRVTVTGTDVTCPVLLIAQYRQHMAIHALSPLPPSLSDPHIETHDGVPAVLPDGLHFHDGYLKLNLNVAPKPRQFEFRTNISLEMALILEGTCEPSVVRISVNRPQCAFEFVIPEDSNTFQVKHDHSYILSVPKNTSGIALSLAREILYIHVPGANLNSQPTHVFHTMCEAQHQSEFVSVTVTHGLACSSAHLVLTMAPTVVVRGEPIAITLAETTPSSSTTAGSADTLALAGMTSGFTEAPWYFHFIVGFGIMTLLVFIIHCSVSIFHRRKRRTNGHP